MGLVVDCCYLVCFKAPARLSVLSSLTTSTKQFKWTSRDNVAHDLLQLIYHSPPYVRRLAASLISAFKSAQAMPQLSQIVLDELQEPWIRIYALRAYASVPGDHLADQFESLARNALAIRAEKLDAPVQYRNYLSITQPDLLDSLYSLVDKYPTNRSWLFALLQEAYPPVAVEFLKSSLNYSQSDDLRAMVVTMLIKMLIEHNEHIDLSVVSALSREDDSKVWEFLDHHFDEILKMSLVNPEDMKVLLIARRWLRLEEAIQTSIPGWHSGFGHTQHPRSRDGQQPNRQDSPAFTYFVNLYEQAKAGDNASYGQLLSIGRRWRGNIPARAVATHYVGKLGEIHNVHPFLSHQLRYADVDWDIELFDAPIRFEAGEALLRFPTPETWEVFVDSYFIQPRDNFKRIQHEWIAYLTDVLSGENAEYKLRHFTAVKNRPWFRALADIPEAELEEL